MEGVLALFGLLFGLAYFGAIIYLVVLAARLVRAVERIADKFERSQ